MGEYSKRIGDVGEAVIVDFLKLIGWEDPMRNEDISSVDSEFRKRSNGIDGYYHYINPMISSTIENILYSSKYSTNPYPVSDLVNTFKSHYTDLAKAIESFKKSTLKQNTINRNDNIDTCFDRGVLFWLNNSNQGEKDIIKNLSNIELTICKNHDGIFLVDNRRIEFIYDAITYSLLKYRDYDIDFVYFNNSLNNDDKNVRNGKIMPVQYINSSILPLRASKEKETVIILMCIDKFDENDLMKYMGIAKNIGCNSQGSTLIGFPDYLETEHLPIIKNIKQSFKDPSFTSNLEVINYNSFLR